MKTVSGKDQVVKLLITTCSSFMLHSSNASFTHACTKRSLSCLLQVILIQLLVRCKQLIILSLRPSVIQQSMMKPFQITSGNNTVAVFHTFLFVMV